VGDTHGGPPLGEIYHGTQVSASASMIQSPRIDANRLSLRHQCAAPVPGRDAVGGTIAIRSQSEPGTMFDPDYAAFRSALVSLACDGHRLLGRIAEGYLEANPHEVDDFLLQIDRLEEEATRYRLEPVRRWLHSVRCLILDKAASSGS
jgi:hypothetical protein